MLSGSKPLQEKGPEEREAQCPAGSRTHTAGTRAGSDAHRSCAPAPGRPVSTKPPPHWWGRDHNSLPQSTMGLRTPYLHSLCTRRARRGRNPASPQWETGLLHKPCVVSTTGLPGMSQSLPTVSQQLQTDLAAWRSLSPNLTAGASLRPYAWACATGMAVRQSIPPAEDLAGWADLLGHCHSSFAPSICTTPSAEMYGQMHSAGPQHTSLACWQSLLSSLYTPQAAIALNVQYPHSPTPFVHSSHSSPKTSGR